MTMEEKGDGKTWRKSTNDVASLLCLYRKKTLLLHCQQLYILCITALLYIVAIVTHIVADIQRRPVLQLYYWYKRTHAHTHWLSLSLYSLVSGMCYMDDASVFVIDSVMA